MSERKFSDSSIKTLIMEMLKRSGMDRRYSELEIQRAFSDVMGAPIAKHVLSMRVRERTLVVRLDSGPLKEELSHSKSRIVQLINEHMGMAVIDQLEIW
jgi:hypothetical protein